MENFPLDGHDYIELNKLLKVMGLSDSGGMAKMAVSDGLVKVDGVVELRKRCKIRSGQIVEFQGHKIRVSSSLSAS
jgi:ribosome-associated protein